MDTVGEFCLATSQQRPRLTNCFYLRAAATCLLERARSVIFCICTRHSFTSRPKGVVFNWLGHFWRDGTAQRESYIQLLYPDFPMGTNKHSQTCTLLSTFHDSLMYCVFVLFFFILCVLCCQSLDCPFCIASSVFSNIFVYWSVCAKARIWAVLYLCVSGITFVSLYVFFLFDFKIVRQCGMCLFSIWFDLIWFDLMRCLMFCVL